MLFVCSKWITEGNHYQISRLFAGKNMFSTPYLKHWITTLWKYVNGIDLWLGGFFSPFSSILWTECCIAFEQETISFCHPQLRRLHVIIRYEKKNAYKLVCRVPSFFLHQNDRHEWNVLYYRFKQANSIERNYDYLLQTLCAK